MSTHERIQTRRYLGKIRKMALEGLRDLNYFRALFLISFSLWIVSDLGYTAYDTLDTVSHDWMT